MSQQLQMGQGPKEIHLVICKWPTKEAEFLGLYAILRTNQVSTFSYKEINNSNRRDE